VQEGSLATERVVRSRLGRVAHDPQVADVRPPAIVVVGPVVDVLDG